MEINSTRIVYMGSPGFAVRPLETLLESGCQVVGVITAADKPAGRGKKDQAISGKRVPNSASSPHTPSPT